MKIFHGIQNIGGMAGALALAQRKLGADTFSYCFDNHFKYFADRHIKSSSKVEFAKEMTKFFLVEGRKFDVFQFYFGESLTGPFLKEVPFLKSIGKKIYFYFCGCDIRDSKQTIKKYKYSACKNCWPMLCSANQTLARKVANKYADKIFVSTPDLLEFVDNGVLLPQPVDTGHLINLRKKIVNSNKTKEYNSNVIKIAHAPSNRAFKGTDSIINIIEELKKESFPIEFTLIENMPYETAMQKCAGADLIIDQILIGSYGQYSVEMMTMGKPVICYIRDDLIQYYPNDLPIISANPDNLKTVLVDLFSKRNQWESIGEKSALYAKHYHDSLAVAKKTLDIYSGEI